ncbi:MAG: hypothetical protein M1419_03375 [Bacteroidetes bacterium]|nr:hypothetical protein [Bacteroidota bacterium]
MLFYRLSFIFAFVLISYSCKDDNIVQENDYFIAKVIGTSVDCKTIFIIKFIDTISLPGYLKYPRFGTYPKFWALNLPDSLKKKELIIKIKFREPLNGEEPPCTSMGPGYRFIFILSAKRDE